jgi:hypothetical protein
MNKLITMSRDEAFKNNLIVDCKNLLLAGGVTLESIFSLTDSVVTTEALAQYFAMVQNTVGISVEKLHQNMGISFFTKCLKMKDEGTPRLGAVFFEMIIEADLATRVIPLKVFSHKSGNETCLTFMMEHEEWN